VAQQARVLVPPMRLASVQHVLAPFDCQIANGS
jgi:hypothetical protein